MNEPATRPALHSFKTPQERHAETIAELRQLYIDVELYKSENEQKSLTIARLNDRVTMLLAEKANAEEGERDALRKLHRLAGAISGIGRLAQEAEAIARMSEFDDERVIKTDELPPETPEEAEAEQQSAAAIVSRLPEPPPYR